MDSGIGKTLDSGTLTISAYPPRGSGGVAMTCWPARAPLPASRTVPEISPPGVKGRSGLSWYSPRHRRMSKKLSAAAWTSITTSSDSGTGSSTRASSSACSGSPSRCTCHALMPDPPRSLLYRLRDYHSDDPYRMLSCCEIQGGHGRKQEGSHAEGQGLHDEGRRYVGIRGKRCRGVGALQRAQHPPRARRGGGPPRRAGIRQGP